MKKAGLKKVLFTISIFCLFIGRVSAFSCGDLTNTAGILGNLFWALSIIVPLLTVALGSVDLAQAVFASNDEGIKKAQKKLFKRILWCIAFFLLVSIVNIMFGLVGVTDATCNGIFNISAG